MSEEQLNDKRLIERIKRNSPYPSFYTGQLSAIYDIVMQYCRGKKFAVLTAGVGTGKSGIAVTAMKVIKEIHEENEHAVKGEFEEIKITALTSTVNLQKQYESQMPLSVNIASLSGKRRYDCANPKVIRQEKTLKTPTAYKEGACIGKGIDGCTYECPYLTAKANYIKTDTFGVMNYKMYLTSIPLKAIPKLIVVDEVHRLRDLLIDQYCVRINLDKLLLDIGNLNIFSRMALDPLRKLSLAHKGFKHNQLIRTSVLLPHLLEISSYFSISIKPKLSTLLVELETKVENHQKGIFTIPEDDLFKVLKLSADITSVFRDLSDSVWKIEEIRNSNPNEWINYYDKSIPYGSYENSITLVCKPLSVLPSMLKSLFGKKVFILMMSGTIKYDLFTGDLKLPKRFGGHVNLDSPFPPEIRKVIPMNVGSFNMKTKDKLIGSPQGDFIVRINNIAAIMPERGIIHSVSYANAKLIEKHCNKVTKQRLVIPKRGQLINERYLNSLTKNCIVLSPVVTEGVSFDYDLARWQIILKIPFGFLGDPYIKVVANRFPKRYLRDAAVDIEQMVGRVTRAMDDYGITFILDSNFSRLLPHFSTSFLTALETSS